MNRQGVIGLFLAASSLPNVAHANIMAEPLAEPGRHGAIQRSQQRIEDARALINRVLEEVPPPRVGFFAQPLTLPAPRFRNVHLLFQQMSDGSKKHYGYMMEVNSSNDRDAPWASVHVSRHGLIRNLYFVGKDSIFSTAAPFLPAGTLERVLAADLSSQRPLDTQAAWNARRQGRLPGAQRHAAATKK